jgi:hypothetical protein
MSRTTAQKKIASFRALLLQAKQHPVAYSFLLQQCLYSIGVKWPEGVFADDFASPGSGRKRSNLGLDALELYEPRKFGWRRVARKLLPEEYKKDPSAAVTKVRKAAANARDQRTCLLTELKNLSPDENQKRLAIFSKMHAESHFPHDQRRMSLEERLKEAAKWPDPFSKNRAAPSVLSVDASAVVTRGDGQPGEESLARPAASDVTDESTISEARSVWRP